MLNAAWNPVLVDFDVDTNQLYKEAQETRIRNRKPDSVVYSDTMSFTTLSMLTVVPSHTT